MCKVTVTTNYTAVVSIIVYMNCPHTQAEALALEEKVVLLYMQKDRKRVVHIRFTYICSPLHKSKYNI